MREVVKRRLWQIAPLALGIVTILGLVRPFTYSHDGMTPKSQLPFAQISKVTIEPEEIHTGKSTTRATAVITVSIFHLSLDKPQSVQLNIGTYSTKPPGAATVIYVPASQTVTIPKAPPGQVVVTARVSRVDIGKNKEVKVVVAATLSNPSPGIALADPRSPDEYQAELQVKSIQ